VLLTPGGYAANEFPPPSRHDPDVDQEQAIYDADKGAWFLNEYFPSNPVFEFADKALEAEGLVGPRESERIETVMLRSIDELLEEYTGANAMGATLTIAKWRHTRVAISEIASKKGGGYNKYGPDLFSYADSVQVENILGTGTDSKPASRIDMPRDQARAINGKIGFAVVADLVEPARVEGSFYIEPKFDRPAERTVDTTVLVANIRCGIAFGPDLSVLATVKTKPPY